MSGRHFGTAAARGALLAACLVATACTSISSPRPSSAPRTQPPVPSTTAPTPAPAPTSRTEPPAVPSVVVPDGAPRPSLPPRTQSDVRSASSALLEQGRSERAAGSYAQATASIERALRLDPNNAELWVERGELALHTGNAAQAATMARKALTLTGDRTLAARAERLLRAASSP
jgi:hypothetical protein